MEIKFNRIAAKPFICWCCKKIFWLEPYKRIKKYTFSSAGIITVTTYLCKECAEKKKLNNQRKEK